MRIFQNLRGKQLKYYNSLDKLKILTFWDILQNKNVFLLDFDYFEGKKYNDAQKEELSNVWMRLYDEYFVLRDSSKSRMELIKAFDEMKLRDKINQIKENAEFLIKLRDLVGLLPDRQLAEYEQSTYHRLKKIDSKIKPLYFDGLEANIINLDKVLKSYINKYNQEHKKRDEAVKEEVKNVYSIVANAESWLERNININDMVVSHWLAIENQIIQKQKAQQKKKDGTK